MKLWDRLRLWFKAFKQFSERGVCPYQFSFILSSGLRRLILDPGTLADRLHLAAEAVGLAYKETFGKGKNFTVNCVKR